MGIHPEKTPWPLQSKRATFRQSTFSFGPAACVQCTRANTVVAWPADGLVIIGYKMLLYCEVLKVVLPVIGNVISS